MRNIISKGVVIQIDHDPNRTAKIGLVYYFNGLVTYIILTEGLFKGSYISSNLVMDNDSNEVKDFMELN